MGLRENEGKGGNGEEGERGKSTRSQRGGLVEDAPWRRKEKKKKAARLISLSFFHDPHLMLDDLISESG